MTLKLKLLALFLLTVQLVYSEDIYPKRVVIKKDTVVAFTDSQCTKILQTFIELDGCKVESNLKDTLLNKQTTQIKQYEELVYLQSKKDSLLHIIINDMDKKYIQTDLALNQIINNQKKKQFQSNLAFGLSTPLFVTMGIIVGLFIHK